MDQWLKVRNETRNIVLPVRARRCVSFFCQLRGLMFRRRLSSDEALLLVGQRESRLETAIHMFFVFFPISVFWLDREGRVVDRTLARPFHPLYVSRLPARDVLEGPPELLEMVAVGDWLTFEP
ncbi:MAG: DUF192 domain-containing protein [Anaerolineae bacterium]|nr:DUF192 domain-containing protein [Anaerolineae bacterium]